MFWTFIYSLILILIVIAFGFLVTTIVKTSIHYDRTEELVFDPFMKILKKRPSSSSPSSQKKENMTSVEKSEEIIIIR